MTSGPDRAGWNQKKSRHSIHRGDQIPPRVQDLIYNHRDRVERKREGETQMHLLPRTLPRLLHTVLLAVLICVAAATATILHTASTSHDTDTATAAIVLDGAPAAHAPADDGGGVLECVGAAMICIAALSVLILAAAHARTDTRAPKGLVAALSPPQIWAALCPPSASLTPSSVLRI